MTDELTRSLNAKDAEIARLRADIARKDAALDKICALGMWTPITEAHEVATAALAPSAERDTGEAVGELPRPLGVSGNSDFSVVLHFSGKVEEKHHAAILARLASPSAPERGAGMVEREPTDEAIEKVARALCAADPEIRRGHAEGVIKQRVETRWRMYVREARAAIAAHLSAAKEPLT